MPRDEIHVTRHSLSSSRVALLSISAVTLLASCTDEPEGQSNMPALTSSQNEPMPSASADPVAAPAPLVASSDPPGGASSPPAPVAAPGTTSTGTASPVPGPSDSGTAGAGQQPAPVPPSATGGGPSAADASVPPVTLDAGTSTGLPDAAGPAEEAGIRELPDPGPEGDGEYEVGPNFSSQPELGDQGAPKGQTFRFTMPLAESAIFDGQDETLDSSKPVNQNRGISVYVPALYEDGTPAPVLVIQDGDGPLGMVTNALDNLTSSDDPERRLPAFVVVAVQNGGNDAQGSERGLEYDTMSDRYARFIDEEVLPAVEANSGVRAAYPSFRFTTDPSGRGALGCSSGGAAAFTMAWFRPDLFSRVVAYSTTLVDQQDSDAPEDASYPHGAWDYHSELELIANSDRKPIRVFLTVSENDLGAGDPESTMHNWVMANERTAAALAAKGYHYRYVLGLGAGHCDLGFQQATLADALIWAWRGYEPSAE
jgi:enterochelin esterase-like enzyme